MLQRLYNHPHAPFVVGFLLRAVAIFVVGHYRAPTLWENGEIAQSVLDGRGFVMGFTGRLEPTSWQAPGYPYLLVGAWSLFGRTEITHLAISLLQALAISSVVYPLGWLTRRWFGPETGVLAKWMACGLPLFAWYPTRIHQVAFAMSFFPWVLAGWVRLRTTATRGLALAVGALTGVAALFQPMILAVHGVLVATVTILESTRGRRAVASQLVLAGLATLLIVLPWTVRNYAVHGKVVPVKNNFGKEFWMGNNPHATGTSWAPGGRQEITSAFPPACFARRDRLSEMGLFEAMQQEAVDFIRTEPSAFIARTARKVAWFWTMAPANLVRHSLGGEAVRFRLLHGTYWAALVTLCLVGFSTAGVPREYRLALGCFFLLYSVVYGLTHVGQARYRGEMEFVFVPLAAAGLLACADRWMRSTR